MLATGKETLKSINDEFDYTADVENTEQIEMAIQKENETSPVEKTGKKQAMMRAQGTQSMMT